MGYAEWSIPSPNPPTARGPGDYGPPDDDGPDRINIEEDTERPWLYDSGYEPEYDYRGGYTWSQVIRRRRHTARRDHADGLILKGDHYVVITTREIDDHSGCSSLTHRKSLLKSANGETMSQRRIRVSQAKKGV